MDVNLTETPSGVRDWLPGAARAKRELESQLAGLFESWSYQEVLTPTIEFYELVQAGGKRHLEEVCKFIDRDGRIVALRPEMTTPIARLASAHFRNVSPPLRLSYLAGVFRAAMPQSGREQEFHQAGVELLGASGPRADAEVIALAANALGIAGLREFRLGVGHVALAAGVLSELLRDPKDLENAKEAVIRKDFVSLEEILDEANTPVAKQRNVLELLSLQGGPQVLDRAASLGCGDRTGAALAELAEIHRYLDSYGVAERVFFDLGTLRSLDYYTGVVFEGYAGSLGFPVCGGGRYDGLLARLGLDWPATGFALGLERVMTARQAENQVSPAWEEGAVVLPDYLLGGTDFEAVIQRAGELRRAGYRIEVDLDGLSKQDLELLGRAKGQTQVLFVGQ